jgi:dihydrofolate reductase
MARERGDFAVRMNALPKYVASTTLEEPLEWENSRLLTRDVAEALAKLKEEPGQDILMYSGVDLMHTLIDHDLIDEYRIWVHPLVLGSGARLFREGIAETTLELVDTTTLSKGVVILAYRRA